MWRQCYMYRRVTFEPLLHTSQSIVITKTRRKVMRQVQTRLLLRTDASVQRRATFNLPDVKQRQLVLSIPQWAKTAQLKGSFNETSNLHFCSSSHISGRCMHEVRRGIQSRRNIAVGSTDGRVISPRLTAHFNNHIASTVPHQRGGFLRFPIQILSSQIQKDIPCSTKS